MELTPQLLETQQFPEKWRGYDQDAVDEFLERVGIGLAELQDRLRTAATRLKELETGGGAAPEVTAALQTAAAPAPSSSIEHSATAVGRALVIAQEAADAALAEAQAEAAKLTSGAQIEADRITSDAKIEADRLVREAEVKNIAATSRLADADAHVAELAEESLVEARSKAARLVSEAEIAAATVKREAQTEADRLTENATELAERHADEVASRRGDALKDLDGQIADRRREATALQSEIKDRQGELRSVVDGLQTLVGRVGSLATPAPAPVAEVEQPAAVVEVKVEVEAPAYEPADDGVTAVDVSEVAEAVVIDLTTDDAKVEHAGSPLVEVASGDDEAETEIALSSMPKWATIEDSEPVSPTAHRGLTVVTSAPEADVETAPVVKVDLDEIAPLAPVEDIVEAEVAVEVVQAPVAVSTTEVRSAIVDDPFLAALRGPDRVEFDDGGEPDMDKSSFKRRRRRRL
jgi:DivIVA domain-containing protein